MFRKLFAFALSVAVLSAAVQADDKKADDNKTETGKPKVEDKKKEKEVKLEGKLVCTRCELGETKACGHALIVKEKVKGKDGKVAKDAKEVEVKYYLKDNGGKEKYHSKVCAEPKPAVVTGKVAEEKVKAKDVTEKDEKKVEKKDATRKVVTPSKVEVKEKE